MEIYSLLVIHGYRCLVCALHMLNYYLSTAFSHVNALQPGVSQSNNVLSWKIFYWFFSCVFVNLMFFCTVAAFLPSNQHYHFLCLSHAFFFFCISVRLFKKTKVFQILLVLIIFSWTSFQLDHYEGEVGNCIAVT